MPSNTTVFKVFRLQMAPAVFFAASCLLVSVQVHAQPGLLSLRGQVVNATCALGQAQAGSDRQQVVRLEVRPGLVMQVNRAANACNGFDLPFSTRFEALAPASSETQGQSGVLIVTYQ